MPRLETAPPLSRLECGIAKVHECKCFCREPVCPIQPWLYSGGYPSKEGQCDE